MSKNKLSICYPNWASLGKSWPRSQYHCFETYLKKILKIIYSAETYLTDRFELHKNLYKCTCKKILIVLGQKHWIPQPFQAISTYFSEPVTVADCHQWKWVRSLTFYSYPIFFFLLFPSQCSTPCWYDPGIFCLACARWVDANSGFMPPDVALPALQWRWAVTGLSRNRAELVMPGSGYAWFRLCLIPTMLDSSSTQLPSLSLSPLEILYKQMRNYSMYQGSIYRKIPLPPREEISIDVFWGERIWKGEEKKGKMQYKKEEKGKKKEKGKRKEKKRKWENEKKRK